MKRKLVALSLAVIMTAALTACGENSSSGTETQEEETTASEETEGTDLQAAIVDIDEAPELTGR